MSSADSLKEVLRDDQSHADPKKTTKSNATTGASAAGIRAVSAQLFAFYFRAPVKAFFRARVDYMAYARAIHPGFQNGQAWSWRVSTPALLAHAIRTYGWRFIPDQVIPPLIANVSVGAVLYTSYLQILARIHEPASHASKRIYPPPDPQSTLAAGFLAGSIQSAVAAPLDALQVRFQTREMLEGRFRSMWHYGYQKLGEIGLRGIFAGWSLALVKDATSCALFFSTFEYVKAQAYYNFLPVIYNAKNRQDFYDPTPIKPHYLLEPSFILAGGVAATVVQQAVQHPLSQIQTIHYSRLESLDYAARLEKKHRDMMRIYYQTYVQTIEQAKRQAMRVGGWRKWLFKDFVWTTLRQTPSTSAGLIVFEIVRRKYGVDEGGKLVDLGGKQFVL